MGAEQSMEEEPNQLPQTEFRIKLKNPNELESVCRAMQTQGLKINAIKEKEGVLWAPATPGLQQELDSGRCMNCEIIPCPYEPKGSYRQQYSATTTSYDTREKGNGVRSPPGSGRMTTWNS